MPVRRSQEAKCGNFSPGTLRSCQGCSKYLAIGSAAGGVLVAIIFIVGIQVDYQYESTIPVVNLTSKVVFALRATGLDCVKNAESKMPDVIATASGPVSASTYCALLEAYYKDLGCNVIAEIANPIYSSENIDDNDCQAFNEKVETSVQFRSLTYVFFALHILSTLFGLCCCHPMYGNAKGAITSLGLAIGCLVCPHLFVATLHEAAADNVFAVPGTLEAGIAALNGGGAGSQLINSINDMGDRATMFPEANGSAATYVGCLVVMVLIPEILMVVFACILPKGGVDDDDDDDDDDGGGFSPSRASRSPPPRRGSFRGGEPKPKPKPKPKLLKGSKPANSPATGHKSPNRAPDRSGPGLGAVAYDRASNDSRARQHNLAWNDGDNADRLLRRVDIVSPNASASCAYVSSEPCHSRVCFKRALQRYAPQCHTHTCGLPKCTKPKSSRHMCCADHPPGPGQ